MGLGFASVSGGPQLLERDDAQAAVAGAVARAVAGDGPLVVVRGPAGIGKTSLLDVARDEATAAGMTVLEARGGALERDLVYGVVGQLLERRVLSAGAQERDRLLDGPARLALPALRLSARPADDAPEEGTLHHGLFWLVANLADTGPHALLIDDAQWADAASLGFLLYLARRLSGLGVLVVVAARSDALPAEAALLDQLGGEPGALVLEPAPLSAAASAALLSGRAGAALPSAAVAAGHEVTGGNPFFLGEVGGALRERPAAEDEVVALVRSLVPEAVRRAILLRLGALGDDARAVAGALAVLGDGAAVVALAAVADRPREAVLAALQSLATAGITAPDRVTDFVHPIVRTAIYGDVTGAGRTMLHERAARALAAAGVGPERVAHHLLSTEPAGDAGGARALAVAGAAALARGDAAIAAALLERAVAEPPSPDERPAVHFDLGRARMGTGDAEAAARDLRIALAGEPDQGRRVRIALHLSDALATCGETSDAVEMLAGTAEALSGDAATRLWVQESNLSLFDPARTVAARQRMLGFADLRGDTPANRLALSNAAIARAFDPGARAVDVAEIARNALADGGLAGDELAPTAVMGPPIYALTMAGDLDGVDRELEHVRARARGRGSLVEFLLYEIMKLDVGRQRGTLGLAAAHGFSAMALARDWGDNQIALRVLSIGAAWLAEVLIEQGTPERAAELVAGIEAVHDLASRPELVWGLEARGLVALAEGRPADALADLTVVGATARMVGYEDRNTPWRLHAARATAATGDRAAALALTAEELALCRTWGNPGPLGAALRAHAMLGPAEEASALLREAHAVVQGSPFRLEAARVAADLGVALRRDGSRAAARTTLEEAADLASACGALAVAERARAELVVLGGRPRRLRINGVDALTPSERRVAVLAASGMTNREIAQELFVTLKTVETHLRQAYRKLEITGRDALPAALAA